MATGPGTGNLYDQLDLYNTQMLLFTSFLRAFFSFRYKKHMYTYIYIYVIYIYNLLYTSHESPNNKTTKLTLLLWSHWCNTRRRSSKYKPMTSGISQKYKYNFSLYTPEELTWNLRIHPWKKNIIWTKPSISGSMLIFGRWIPPETNMAPENRPV